MAEKFPTFTSAEILAVRPNRNHVSRDRPYAYLVEPEFNAHSEVVDVATLFLTNSECPYHCLMCDLWKNTLPRSEESADIPQQIRFALKELSPAQEIKLYNSGNFFDSKAIPPEQYAEIAELVKGFKTVIVENHPNLCSERCVEFQEMIRPANLEVALGLETCHPELLRTLNKGMTLADYEGATTFLLSHDIAIRTFILLKPPFLEEQHGIDWALKSIDYAFGLGVNCCSLVPTRAGNGMMEDLHAQGDFSPPKGSSMEFVLEEGIKKQQGRVFMDLWDAEKFFACQHCQTDRIARLNEMNLAQKIFPSIRCRICES
ncbi:radical SAM protein [bacterium]|jgi:archaeosine synthase beta-subunit|nr:radical SAM protein [bacterium]